MRKILFLLPILAFLFQGCTKDGIPTPDANFNIFVFENYEYQIVTSGVVNKTMYLMNTGEADFLVVYSGKSKQIYADSISKGLPMIKDAYFELLYKTAGSYDITVVATNVDDYGNSVQAVETKAFEIVAP